MCVLNFVRSQPRPLAPSPPFFPSSPSPIPGGWGGRGSGDTWPCVGQCNGPGLGAIRGPGGCRGQRHRGPRSTMTQSRRPSGPALASFLLTVLLGGEWSQVSVHPSVPGHPFLLLHGEGSWMGTHFQRRRRRLSVVRGPGGSVGTPWALQSQRKLRSRCARAGGGGGGRPPVLSAPPSPHLTASTWRVPTPRFLWEGVQGQLARGVGSSVTLTAPSWLSVPRPRAGL